MSKDKEMAAVDAVQEQDLRQFVDTGIPRQATQPEPDAPEAADTG
jgi:hypothetical protein